MRHLKLDRPLVAFDLETTGVRFDRDRIVEIALVRVEPDGSRRTFRSLVNPEMPIPAGATAVHGITDDDVRDAPRFATLVDEVQAFFADADLAGFNSARFDAPMLEAEFARVGATFSPEGRRHLDAMRIFHRMEPRTLTAAYKKYCGEELTDAHSALADVEATLAVLDAQVGRYDEVPDTSAELHAFCHPDEGKWVDKSRKFAWNDDGEAAFTFGKYAGMTLKQVKAENAGYLEWMLGKDFSDEVAAILREALDGRFPERR